MFYDKYGEDSVECNKLYEMLDTHPVHIFHLTKVAADRECRALYIQSDMVLSDLNEAKNLTRPLTPQHLPFMFFFMDMESSFEESLSLLYTPNLL